VAARFAKVQKSSLLTTNTLPLALDNALKRMLMFAGKRDHLVVFALERGGYAFFPSRSMSKI
jgi:hypothetical protein